MSHETTETEDSRTSDRELIARIDGTMEALARERARLEARAAEHVDATPAPETTPRER